MKVEGPGSGVGVSFRSSRDLVDLRVWIECGGISILRFSGVREGGGVLNRRYVSNILIKSKRWTIMMLEYL